MKIKRFGVAVIAIVMLASTAWAGPTNPSVAREWNDELLEAIRNDYARPTVHVRNLYHVSVAMWDAWAAYDEVADQVIHHEKLQAKDVEAARREAISFATFRILMARFSKSPGADDTVPSLIMKMDQLTADHEFEHDRNFASTVGTSAAALGNRIAVSVLAFGLADNANEQGGYENLFYEPINEPILPDLPGNPDITDPNRWQPIALEFFVDQSGNIIVGGYPDFLSPEWGQVTPFALSNDDLTIYQRDGFDYWVYHDPGPPPHIGGDGDDYYKWGNAQVTIWGSHLDAADGVMWDVSPTSIGNSQLPQPEQYADYYDLYDGNDWGSGYTVNPVTGVPYPAQMVPRGDYARILAEFWADGPDSETPPGHWFTLLNYVSDHASFEKRLNGQGPIIDDLQWDVMTYLAMGGCMHDIAISAWGVKGWYDYIRPVSAIRYMADQGQSTDPNGPSYDPNGIPLHDGLIEVITLETTQPGARHAHLAGNEGKIALNTWRGHEYIDDPDLDVAGVGWILADFWWPYQRPSFVTPPFAGYVSGHSTYSRAAAELMTLLTGSPYFPDGLGEFHCPAGEFLVFEDGPSMDVTLQWASYRDASDQCSLSRIWGGIHPGADDLPGRLMGLVMGPDAYYHAVKHYNGQFSCPADTNGSGDVGIDDLLYLLGVWTTDDPIGDIAPAGGDGVVDIMDLLELISTFGACP